MALFLSDEWLAELAAELRAAPGLADGPQLELGQLITGVPTLEGGDLAYLIRFGGGAEAAVVPGSVQDADVVLVEDYETARAIASGAAAASMLAEGKIKLRGDANALVGAQDQLAMLGDALVRLAATTHFEESGQAGSPDDGQPVLERAVITVRPGTEAAFAAAFPEARAVILSADGCNSARLLRGIESASSFLLLVEWDSLAHHMEGFRNSPLFAEWRAILGPYFAEPPVVDHFFAAD